MNVLYAYHTSPLYMAPKQFSATQVNCGPYFEDQFVDGRCVSLATPHGHYDIMEIVARLPVAQKPDLLVVKADAARANFPTNIKALNCPTVLVVGDTQHMERPLTTMLGYAAAEPFDFIMTDHGRRVLHHFSALGTRNTFWIPGINLRVFDVSPSSPPTFQFSFVGHFGATHPLRATLLKGLLDRAIPLHVRTAPQDLAARIYADSLINLNLSLNGDVNLRVFEVVAHGGLLITDALKAQAGLGDLFKIGREVLTFRDVDELAGTIQSLLEAPEQAMMIANRGYSRYLREHTPEIRLEQFFDILEGRPVPEYLHGDYDRRVTYEHSRGRSAATFIRDIGVYEIAQALNRSLPRGGIVAFSGIDVDLIASLSDLSRLSMSVIAETDEDAAARGEAFGLRGVADQVRVASARDIETFDRTMLLVDSAHLADPALRACIESGAAVVYVQNCSETALAESEVLGEHGFMLLEGFEGVFVSAAAAVVLTQLLG